MQYGIHLHNFLPQPVLESCVLTFTTIRRFKQASELRLRQGKFVQCMGKNQTGSKFWHKGNT